MPSTLTICRHIGQVLEAARSQISLGKSPYGKLSEYQIACPATLD
jgi:hypothetical protein